MTLEEARIEIQSLKDTFEEYEPGGTRDQFALKIAISSIRAVSRYHEALDLEPEDILSETDIGKVVCALHELKKFKELGDMDRLRELVEADRDGRCVVRPCKVGDILYEIDETEYGVITCKVLSVNCFNCHALRIPQNPVVDNVVVTIEVIDGHGKGSSYDFAETDFGKTVFLYRETAEAALKGVPLC